jgi:hypothetical protein
MSINVGTTRWRESMNTSSKQDWVVVGEVSGALQANLIRGLLEAQDIAVLLSQEGAGRAYGINVGELGRVQILVPLLDEERAEEILAAYYQGDLFQNDG